MRRVALALLISLTWVCFAQSDQFGNGPWHLYPYADPITDENRSAIWVHAVEYPHEWGAGLFIRCSSDPTYPGVQVAFIALEDLGPEDYYAVAYRFDRDDPVFDTWPVTTDGDSVLIPKNAVTLFIRALADAARLSFRIYDAANGDLTFVMPTEGSREALDTLGCFTGEL